MLNYRNGVLHLEEKSLKSLADEVGTPVFLFSESQLRANYTALMQGLSAHGRAAIIRYCAKTNNESAVLTTLAACGSEVMVSHLGEAQLALQCGFAPDKIAYQRPVIVEEEVRAVLKAGITLFHAYGMQDLQLIEEVTSSLGIKIRISLRLRNDSLVARLSPLGFLSRRLGFQAVDIESAMERLQKSQWLKFYAINFYCGTQQESIAPFRALIRKVVRMCLRIQTRFGIVPEEINFGGGAPSGSLVRIGLLRWWNAAAEKPEGSDSPQLLEAFARDISAKFSQEAQSQGLTPVPAVAMEPGRSIVGNAGILLGRVCALRENWAILDASHNYLPESSLAFRRRVLPLTETRAKSSLRHYHLSGGTLNTLDVIDFRRKLPNLEVGDILCFADAGAYSISRASRYAGLSPAVYMLRAEGTLQMIRRPEGFSDLICPMLLKSEVRRDG